MTNQQLQIIKELLKAAEEVIKSQSHLPKCKFAGCTCGAAEARAELISNYQ